MPYKEPLGARSVIGRKLLTSLQHSFEGERMLAGEILFRTDKVRSIVQQGDEEGYKVEAKVYTSNRNLCKERHGEYSTWIKVLPYKNTELDNLLQHLMATEVWGDMLNAHLRQHWYRSRAGLEEIQPSSAQNSGRVGDTPPP